MAVAVLSRIFRVLIVDSLVDDARALRDLLAGMDDIRVQAARDPGEANAILREGAFDAALVDAALWSDEGTGLARFIREERPDVAVVVLTGGEHECDAIPSLKLGAHDFISRRAANEDQLRTRILAAIEENRTLRRRDTMVRWLEREARTDHLTGLYNRRAFDERLHETCARSRARQEPVALILIDVTGTRTVNDVHGHEAGDAMIRRAAMAVSRSVRAIDFAARIGGDDFAVVVENGDMEMALRIARRIAHQTEYLNTTEWDGDIPVSLSFGVASGLGCEEGALLSAASAQLTDDRRCRPLVTSLRWREETDGPSVA